MKRFLRKSAANGAVEANRIQANRTCANRAGVGGRWGASSGVQDTYVLRNAVLLSDGTPLLASDGTPVTYKEAM